MNLPLDPQTLEPLRAMLRQLRDIKGVTERRPGVFYVGSTLLLQIGRDAHGGVHADIRRVASSASDRMPLDGAEQQRRVVDEARKRAAKLDDD